MKSLLTKMMEQDIFKPASDAEVARRMAAKRPIKVIHPRQNWYEVFEDEGEEQGTHSIIGVSTYEEALREKAKLEAEHPDNIYGIDKWYSDDDNEVQLDLEWTPAREQNESLSEADIFKPQSDEQVAKAQAEKAKNMFVCPNCKEPIDEVNVGFYDGIGHIDKSGHVVVESVRPEIEDVACPRCGDPFYLDDAVKKNTEYGPYA
jgi:formylmethanofuran dehydrogenase subunit E